MNISELKAAYQANTVAKPDFISSAYAMFHANLFDYANNLSSTDIREISIDAKGVVFTVRSSGIKVRCQPGDHRSPPVETFNFSDFEPAESRMMHKLFDGLKNADSFKLVWELARVLGAEVGATRVLTLQDGGKINETLTARDDASMTMKYDITESVLPVREYSATIQVQSAGGKTTVLWKSMFKRQDPANPPAAGKDDKTARDTITHIFKTGLENLKKISEK